MAHKISFPVGKPPAKNVLRDMQTVTNLLNRVDASSGGPDNPIPLPAADGKPSAELLSAILKFQRRYNPPQYQDGVVDPTGRTLRKLNEIVGPFSPLDPLDGPPVAPPPAAPSSPVPSNPEVATWYYISWALAAFAREREFDRLWHAAAKLMGERNARGSDGKPCNCGNKPLAYAEHYMLARAVVASGGDDRLARASLFAIASAAIAVYDLGKLANALYAKIPSNRFQSVRKALYGLIYHLGDCPMSDKPPDPESVKWGLLGARQGMTPL
jgi:hypothetical protein